MVKVPTVAVEVEWRRALEIGESVDLLVGEGMAEAIRRASVLARAAGMEVGCLRGWELTHASATERRPYPLSDLPLRLDGFSGAAMEDGSARTQAAWREGRVVIRGVWDLTEPLDSA